MYLAFYFLLIFVLTSTRRILLPSQSTIFHIQQNKAIHISIQIKRSWLGMDMRIQSSSAIHISIQFSQLSNSNKKQNLGNVKICGSHRFEEDREATMGDGRENKLSASASTSTSASTLCLQCVRARFFLLQNPFLSLITEICWCFEFHLIFCFVFLIFFFF